MATVLLSERSIQLTQILLLQAQHCAETRIAQSVVLSADQSKIREVLVGILLLSLPFLFNHAVFWIAYHLDALYRKFAQMPRRFPYPDRTHGKTVPFIHDPGFIIMIECTQSCTCSYVCRLDH